MKRAPTAEQKQKAAERRERFHALCKEVAELSEDARAALVMRAGGILTCEGRPLSTHNSCLILSQFGDASVVGGFWQWQRSGRRVRKGSTGLSLWIPTKGRGDGGVEPVSHTQAAELTPTFEAEGDGETGKAKGRGRFIVGTVFDITQTEAMDGPEVVAVAAGYPDDENQAEGGDL